MRILLFLFLLVASSPGLSWADLDFEGIYGSYEGCAVLVGIDTETTYNSSRAATRFAPCSTFKVPNTMIALEEGAIKDAEEIIAWDGVERERVSLNRDHNLRSAFKYSVLWFYQELARRVGEQRMQHFLDVMAYGNRDMSGGLTDFWLASSLGISAHEQVEFLRKLHTQSLPFSDRTYSIVKDIMIVEESESHVLRGKTGSDGNGLGWFVGWVEKEGDVLYFAINISGEGGWGGEARRITLEILRESGWLPATDGDSR